MEKVFKKASVYRIICISPGGSDKGDRPKKVFTKDQEKCIL